MTAARGKSSKRTKCRRKKLNVAANCRKGQKGSVLRRGAEGPTNYYLNFPKTPTAAVRDDAAGVVKVRHSVDANGKTTNVEVISEPVGSQTGEYLKKALPRLDFT